MNHSPQAFVDQRDPQEHAEQQPRHDHAASIVLWRRLQMKPKGIARSVHKTVMTDAMMIMPVGRDAIALGR